MGIRQLRAALLVLSVSTMGSATIGAFAAEPLASEEFTVDSMPPKGPHWVYVIDEAFYNEIDSRVRVFDGDSYRHLGQIDAGFNPGVILSPDGKTTGVTTTYFSRGGHGARTDIVEFTDNASLAIAGEIVLPPKRAMMEPTYFNLSYAPSGRFAYVAYITPAMSFGVLDVANKKVVTEVDTAGCALVIPTGPSSVSSLCDSGRLLTVALDGTGHETSRALSEPFFDPDADPIFVQGIPSATGYTFISFAGQVHDVGFSGDKPVIAAPWSLVNAAERGVWRPGGQQIGAINRRLARLYVPMHKGDEGAHKEGGTEIWVFDLDTHKRIARWPVTAQHLKPAIAVQVTQDDKPLLFTGGVDGTVAVWDAVTGHVRHTEKTLGQSPWFFLTP